MQAINWQQFGLKKDPYDTPPLIEGGDLPIEKAFVGRVSEMNFLNNLFESVDRLCLTVCGNVGVGKTSLANFHKVIWKYKKPRLLFSFRREIEVHENLLHKKDFLIEIIASVLREIRLIQPDLLKNDFLSRLNNLVDISQSLALSGGLSGSLGGNGLGFDFSREKSIQQPLQVSISALEEHFVSLIDFLMNNEIGSLKYSGLIVHVNNFDVVLSDETNKKKIISFFNEMRDLLQTPNVFWLFIGPKNFYKDIISSQKRVKGIFIQTPLQINPLSKTEIARAFEERMSILQSEGVSGFIKPIDDEVVFNLYDLHEGDVRSIMTSVRDILGQCSDSLAKPLSAHEAMSLLGRDRWEKIENVIKLTSEQREVLKYLIVSGKNISQKDVARILEKAQSNVSNYYFKPLRDNGIIEEKEQKGKVKYYGLTSDYVPLKWLFDSREELKKDIEEKFEQLSLPIK